MTNSLREAMEEAMTKQKTDSDSGMVLEADTHDEIEEAPDAVDTTVEGQEKATQPKKEETQEADKTAKKEIPSGDKQDNSTVPSGTTDKVPATFTKEEQAQWANVPPLVKNAISRIESQSQTAVLQAKQELADTKRENAARDTVLEPYAKLWMQNGVPVQQGLATAMKAVYEFEKDPKGTLQRLAQQYGISLAEDGNDQYVDPVMSEVEKLKQQVQSFEQSQRQSQQSVIEQRNIEEASRFTDAKDDKGNLLHPHWEKVLPQMQALLPAVGKMNPGMHQQDLMKRAYDIACQQNESVRAEIASNQSAQQQQQDFERRRDAALKAKSGIVSSPASSNMGNDSAPRQKMSIRDTLKVAMQDGLGRV